ncbi:MAG: hypothetical protein PHI98_16520 [Eubacteriales bacterium]|nr:hypothetical protein [Eubacteriales bacterium]
MKKPIMISAFCIALAAALLFWGFRWSGSIPPQEEKTYGLTIQSDTGSYVMQLRKGMQQAADELGVRLEVYTQSEARQADGLAGAVLWLEQPSAEAERLKSLGIPVSIVGQTLPGFACVLGDAESAGKQLALYALSQADKAHIVLLTDDVDEGAAARSRAALAVAKAENVAILGYLPDMGLPENCDLVVTVSQRATLDMIQRKRNQTFKGMVLGVDTGESRSYDLEEGVIDAMALDSPYAIGYLALYQAYGLANGDSVSNDYAKVLLATRENMYLSENVKQVFPLLH